MPAAVLQGHQQQKQPQPMNRFRTSFEQHRQNPSGREAGAEAAGGQGLGQQHRQASSKPMNHITGVMGWVVGIVSLLSRHPFLFSLCY